MRRTMLLLLNHTAASGCVALKLSKCVTACIVVSVPFDIADEMVPSDTSMVLSTALAYHRKVPTTSWTLVIPFSVSGSAVSSLSFICTFAPYVGSVHLLGAFCGLVGVGCSKRCRAFLMYPSMERSTHPSS